MNTGHRFPLFVLITVSHLLCTGCASTSTSNTARTAKEQLLLSDAVEQSLSKVDFRPLQGQRVFVDEKYLECVDKPYIVGSVRHNVMRSGAFLMDKAEDADVIMELRSGGVGTDTSEAFVGTPEIALPGMLSIPEIRLAERRNQLGYAKIGMLLYDAKSRQVLGDGGVAMARSDDNNWFLFGMGPVQSGSLKKNVANANRPVKGMNDRQLPMAVAFGSRNAEEDGPRIQHASGESEE